MNNICETEEEVVEYIRSRNYHCAFCKTAQDRVINEGLSSLKPYKGMICGSVEDMLIRLWEYENQKEWKIDPITNDLFS